MIAMRTDAVDVTPSIYYEKIQQVVTQRAVQNRSDVDLRGFSLKLKEYEMR